jgi:hypothetical protein
LRTQPQGSLSGKARFDEGLCQGQLQIFLLEAPHHADLLDERPLLRSFEENAQAADQDRQPEARGLLWTLEDVLGRIAGEAFRQKRGLELGLADLPKVDVGIFGAEVAFNVEQSRHRENQASGQTCNHHQGDQG